MEQEGQGLWETIHGRRGEHGRKREEKACEAVTSLASDTKPQTEEAPIIPDTSAVECHPPGMPWSVASRPLSSCDYLKET